MRLEDQSRWLWERYPEEYLDIAIFITDLGDVTAVMVLLSLLYWLVDREKSALIVSYAVIGISVILLLKAGFAMPRPEVEIVARGYDEYGFPSGHAFSAVIVYGGLLWVFEHHRNPPIAAGVIGLIVAISLSRIVLGVHYLADIIAGAALGVGFLLAMEFVADRNPQRAFAVGAILPLPTIIVTSGEATALAVVGLGTALGGVVGTQWLDRLPALRSRSEGAILTVCGLVYLVTLSVLESIVAAGEPLISAVFFGILTAGILIAPLAVSRIVPNAVVQTETTA